MDINKNSYNKICEQWKNYRNKSAINPCIVEFIQYLKPASNVLDVGCGTGYPIAAYLAGQGFSVTGIDVSENMIEKARSLQLSNAEFYLKDILEFEPVRKYDGVVAFDSLWHICKEKQPEIYRIISSLMNVGGYFLFTHGKCEGNVSGTMFGEEFHYSALNTKDVHTILENNGFEIILSVEDYKEETTGERDLLIIAKKIS